ncbi:uncharacterized protein [Gossypium hirsutum]|uniref:Uncharacterized protein isoform X1 n=1 Tax=Gossypium hirsutum TaxID=3635 RepID=A0ABM3BP20_GOSHI|nr:uncharacterized protein LOC121229231 isoform X1 [Gossypium hirsutum]
MFIHCSLKLTFDMDLAETRDLQFANGLHGYFSKGQMILRFLKLIQHVMVQGSSCKAKRLKLSRRAPRVKRAKKRQNGPNREDDTRASHTPVAFRGVDQGFHDSHGLAIEPTWSCAI